MADDALRKLVSSLSQRERRFSIKSHTSLFSGVDSYPPYGQMSHLVGPCQALEKGKEPRQMVSVTMGDMDMRLSTVIQSSTRVETVEDPVPDVDE